LVSVAAFGRGYLSHYHRAIELYDRRRAEPQHQIIQPDNLFRDCEIAQDAQLISV